VSLLAQHGIAAHARADAPGVYVDAAKIASLGLRIKHGRSYHGLALNVEMDLSPFDAIDPCGYRGLQVTQLCDLGITMSAADVGRELVQQLATRLDDAHAAEEIYA
jgi:lipoyl(octanoyl) transferase